MTQQPEDHHIIRYGMLYGSRMPWMRDSDQILAKIALANTPRPKPIDIANNSGNDHEVRHGRQGIWRQYVHLYHYRIKSTPGQVSSGFDVDKVDRMMNYGRYFDAV